MGNLSETTKNILLSGLMGFLGGMLTIPINAIVNWALKRDELSYKHRLDMIAKKQELILQYKLDMQKSEAESKRAILRKQGMSNE
jgi:hypothetical protein